MVDGGVYCHSITNEETETDRNRWLVMLEWGSHSRQSDSNDRGVPVSM